MAVGGGWRDRREAMKVKNAGIRLENDLLCLFFFLCCGVGGRENGDDALYKNI